MPGLRVQGFWPSRSRVYFLSGQGFSGFIASGLGFRGLYGFTPRVRCAARGLGSVSSKQACVKGLQGFSV